MTVVADVVAQAVAVTDATPALLQYGALGVIAALALGAVRVLFLRITASADLERQRADRLEAELRQLNADLQQKYAGVLADATHALSEALAAKREDRR